ncbi:MAG: molybdate ABC transporter permease subunit [Leptolyngbya sp. DLM2.Bin15]|nr:MAG: molybdate ABC transporter permease subunit [Leptolyngbya sp. DLM2.Bin15]
MPNDLAPLWISLKTAFSATLLVVILGILIARWMLSYRGRARGLIDGILTLPLVLPPTVVGFFLLLLLGKHGPIGRAIAPFGITVIFTWTAVVLAATVVAFPLMYKTVLSAFEQVDPTLISSARTLGASEWRIFWQILLPLAWPGLLAGTVLAFARALGEFGATLMVGGSIPGVTQTIPIAIFFAAESGRMGVALVWVVLMVAISLFVIAGINYGNRTRSHTPTLAHGLVTLGFNWIFFKRLKIHLFGIPSTIVPRDPNSRVKPTFALVSSSPSAHEAAHLTVAIEKQVPGFRLKVQVHARAEPLGILGASGSGKSITLRCIAGLETPSQGRIVLNNRVLFDSEQGINVPSRDRRVGLVFQNYALFPHLTVAQNIAFGMQAIPRQRRAAEVVKYIDMIDLSGMGDRYPHQLSGGQQQRVALARAMAIQPDILLLDEPLSALDSYLRSHIEKLLIELLSHYQGITIFITHKLEEAYRVCDHLLVLSGGQILAEGSKQDIFERPPTVEVAQITECKNFSQARRVDEHHIEALDWGCCLQIAHPMASPSGYVGLRAHHVQFPQTTDQSNTYPGWLAMTIETQHRVTLYIKLHSKPQSPQDYHLQAELYRDQWHCLQHRPLPWPIHLNPASLITMPY